MVGSGGSLWNRYFGPFFDVHVGCGDGGFVGQLESGEGADLQIMSRDEKLWLWLGGEVGVAGGVS